MKLPKGTEFQRKVWREIAKIPFGKTKTYKEIAEAIGHPLAYRAVGQACKKNPVPIIPPRENPAPTLRRDGDESAFGMSSQIRLGGHRGVPIGATGVNPWGSIIPCHRVISSSGSLGGYSGGIKRKKILLDMEKGGRK